uniref:Gypsy retrotransposon integrase-like protein 1 n=1 Tax=Astyanax mexicanus TaxID=7994 RepID=A0A3B1K8B9_ASTMX
MALSGSLAAFVQAPSVDLLNVCRKDVLLEIAQHFGISVSKSLVKRELKRIVMEGLVDLGVLASSVEGDTTVASATSASSPISEKPVAVTPASQPVEPPVVQEIVQTLPGTRATLPRFDPFSPLETGSDSREKALVKVRVARLQFESEEKRQKLEMEKELAIRRMELDVEREVRLRELELGVKRSTSNPVVQKVSSPAVVELAASEAIEASSQTPCPSTSSESHSSSLNVSKLIALVPPFRETEVDTYFCVFERIALALSWPKDLWTLLLQCKLTGKAQDVLSSLSLNDSLDYDIVKTAVLRAYELVPEAYRQRFRNCRKGSSQTFVEFSREKLQLFDKWCAASKVDDYDKLRELILLEEFKTCLPESVVVYLNERHVKSVSEAAVLADEYVLTHRSVFKPVKSKSGEVKAAAEQPQPRQSNFPTRLSRDQAECYYCHKPGHIAVDCPALKRKQEREAVSGEVRKGVAFVKTVDPVLDYSVGDLVSDDYRPFVSKGFVSLGDKQSPVQILRDTGAALTLMLADVLPSQPELSFCGSHALCQGIDMSYMKVPLHEVYLKSDLVSGHFKVGVCSALPVKGVQLILGNDIAGGRVVPVPEVIDKPSPNGSVEHCSAIENLPMCAVTRAQSQKYSDAPSLSDTFLARDNPLIDFSVKLIPVSEYSDVQRSAGSDASVSRECLIKAQQTDPSLAKYLSLSSTNVLVDKKVGFYFEHGVLMRKWTPRENEGVDDVCQIVVPSDYRPQVLQLAHDHPWSGHQGIAKTYARVLRHFFWPALKQDVTVFCRSCDVCQRTGKPNQVIPLAPLHPIPAVGEPFERVLVDCVGPLPRTKSGNQFLLTVMCAATRFPEAFPLRKISAPSVLKALTKFFSIFGLPKIIQTDQGTNFMSRVFSQVMKTLQIKHVVSSSYHPESQGALERFHQTLKSMLRKYCLDSGRQWDDGVPFALFATREAVQESLGFSPAQLVFGHSVRGPLKLLKESFLSDKKEETNVLDYVSKFREHLHAACQAAKTALCSVQGKMKQHYDRKTVPRQFQPGDKVLVLLPLLGSSLSAKFSGPYVIQQKLSETDYVVKTPDRNRKSRVCHINMLKSYVDREVPEVMSKDQVKVSSLCETAVPVAVSKVTSQESCVQDTDGLVPPQVGSVGARLSNSEMLCNLSSLLHI